MRPFLRQVPQPAVEDATPHQALDTLAAVIRLLGHHAPLVSAENAPRFGDQCEAWAAHLLSLTPPPGMRAVHARRDWDGLRRFVRDARSAEFALVQKAVGDLRLVVTTIVTALNQSFQEDEQSDRHVLAEMEALCGEIASSSTENIKQRAASAAHAVATAMERRRVRHHQQLTDLTSQVSRLGSQLTEAEREKALDPLTRLYNRRVLDSALAEAWELNGSHGRRATLLMIDVDHFKRINDGHGHPAGDAVLKALANTIVRCFPRRSDVVTRFGGEEFAVLLTDTGQEHAAVAVKRLLDAVRAAVTNHLGQDLELPRFGGHFPNDGSR
mgnify:CR=1 FL=1